MMGSGYLFVLPPPLRAALIVAIACLGTSSSWASGSYAGRPPQPPAGLVADAQRYELGKAIYGRRFTLQDQAVDRLWQTSVLLKLQEQLPASAKQQMDLREFAGKLNSEQLGALEHFIKTRYRIGAK